MTHPAKPAETELEPGQLLRRAREKLRLKYRDVEEASRQIAARNGNDEFFVGLSRLADIENRGTVPSIFRLYSLCAIYGLEWSTALLWYGIDLNNLAGDSARLHQAHSRLFEFSESRTEAVEAPHLSGMADLRATTYISREILRWGALPVALLKSLDLQNRRYAFLGTDDWSMYPILAPGSFLHIDESRNKISQETWVHEIERPVYFLEHRSGFRVGWCTQTEDRLILQPHWSSPNPPEVFQFPGEIDVLGQVVGVAMRIGMGRRRHTRFSTGRG